MPAPTEANAGPPPAYGTDTSHDKNLQDLHEVFKFSAKLQFAEAICKIDPIPLNRVQLLLDACPIPSEETLKFEKAEYFHAVSLLLSFRSQESLLALAHFYVCSKGQFETEIIPRLIAYLDVLKLLKFSDYNTLLNAERFSYHLAVQLASICWNVPRGRAALLEPFLSFYQYILQHNNLPLIYGTLTAMGEVNFPFSKDQAKVVSAGLDSVISNIVRPVEYKDINGDPKPMLLMIFKVMEQLTRSSIGIPPDLSEQLYSYGHYFVAETTPPPPETLFIQIVIVMVRVCICEPPLAERVFLCLLDWLSAATSPMRLCASPLLYQATLRGIAEIAACYPTKLHKIIEPLRDFVLYGAPNACDTGLHDEAVSALCSVLRLEMTTHGVEVPRQIINSLFNILHPSMHYTPTSPPLSTNSASATPGSPSPEEQLHRIIISLLGRITCALDDPKVTEICMPNFISRISYPPTDLDLLMLEQLTNIALLGQQNSTNEVVNLMINLFKKIVKDPNHGVIVNTIPAALHNLALGLTNVKLRQDLCLRTLKLFQQLAKSVKLAPDYSHSFGPNLSSPVLKGMGFLLPTMAELAQLHLDSAHILNPDPITLKLFRNVWFYCVLFRYTTVGTWRSDWRDAAARLALQMPVIITSKAHIYLEMELELDNILKQGFDKDEFNQTQKRLLQLLPAVAYQLRSLTFPQSAYILCVYTLETLRVRSPFPSFKAIFSYLEDQGIDNPSVVACLRAIADTVFSEFLNLMGSTVSNPAREAELAEHTQFLLVHFCHPVEAVRKAADQYILSMAERFPQVLWSKPCVVTLMELLECVGTGAVSRPLDMLSAVLPSSGYQINLPDDTPSRHRLLQVLRQLCCVWLRTGISHAPSETHAVLHDYIRDVVQPSTRTVLLIVEIASAPPDTSDASIPSVEAKSGKQAVAAAAAAAAAAANAISVPEDCSLFVHSLELKAKYSGEVKGMLKLLADVAADGQADAARMERFLLRDFTAFQLQNQNVSSGAVHEIQQVLFRAAAYLVESGQPGSAELLHNICWIPVKTFTEESLVVGVAVWEWLLAERPDLGNRVMNGIGEAWAWSVDTRIGLFSRASRPPNPLSIVQKHDSPVDTGEVHGHLPHRIWLKFIESRFAVVRHNNPTQLDILTTMLHKAVADPHALSIQPSSLGARFQLLLLCQKFIQAGVCDLVSEVLLRERLYASTATWFYYEAMWYHYDSSKDDFDENVIIDGKKELQADVKLLIDFCKSLAAERIFEPESSKTPNAITPETRGRVPTEPTPIHQAISISTSTSFSHMRNTPLASSVSLDPPMPGSISGSNSASFSHTPSSGTISAGSYSIGTSGVLSSSTGTISRNMTVNSSIRVTPIDLIGMGLQGTTTSTSAIPSIRVDKGALGSIDEGRLRELRKRRNLLILLVGHEIERIVVWNNPLNRISLQIPEEQKFKYDNLPKNLKCTWRDYIVTAWSISSKLAIQLVNRFPQGRMQKVLQELILAEPTRALEIPDALQVLVTEDTVRANIPELKMLLYWTSVTPPKALSFLGRAYQSHPLVTQYAIRVLQSFSPETIIFYLPQLVQTLRYDKTDLIEAYLMDAALRNEFLAHQLIWNLQTYTETDPMDPNARSPNDDFTRKCLHLRDRVLAAMDPRSLRQFREEFDFFNNFTVLSGKLLKVEVAQRRGVLKEDLRAQRVDSGTLYLPTNPNNVVVGIDVESCMTLQSAAKVPILVNFKVVSRESSHYTGAAKSTSAITPNGSMTSLPLLSHSQQGTSSAPLASSVPLQSSSAPQPRRGSRQMARDPIVRVQGCIFKSGDDTRQDMLALQVIDLFKRIFQSVGLDLYLFPYKVIATKPGCGIIELVPNTMSRDQLGKKVDGSLFDYFIAKYGPKNSLPFQTARRNFIQSMAAYAIVSYILQIKDRHNGNILVDDEGHIVHIDFGFIFDISPGGDFKFENSPFKLSQEMIDIMGGKPNAEQFVWFMELGVKAFLAVRQHVDAIITLVDLMLPTQLPCFKEVTLTNLKTRFCPERNETDAAKFGAKIMAEGFSRSSTFFTYFYDLFQYIDNGIDF